MNPYFPGDAPGAEMLGILGFAVFIPALVFALGWWFMIRSHPRARFIAVTLILLPMVMGGGGMGIAAVEVGKRHFGEWAELKGLIARYSQFVAAERRGS